MSAMIADEACFEGIFDDLQKFEEEEQAGRAEQQGAGDVLSSCTGIGRRIGGLQGQLLRLP
jgi:hypothetical protein